MDLGSVFGDAIGGIAGTALANSRLNDMRKFMINTIDEVFELEMSDKIASLIVEEAIPVIGAAGSSIAEIGMKHMAAIEAMEDGNIQGFTHQNINIDGKNVEVWIDASDPNNPIHYTDKAIVGSHIDPQDRNDYFDKVDMAVEKIEKGLTEETQGYINKHGQEGYIRRVEDFIEDKLNSTYVNRKVSFNNTPAMDEQEVREFAEVAPAVNVNAPLSFG